MHCVSRSILFLVIFFKKGFRWCLIHFNETLLAAFDTWVNGDFFFFFILIIALFKAKKSIQPKCWTLIRRAQKKFFYFFSPTKCHIDGKSPRQPTHIWFFQWHISVNRIIRRNNIKIESKEKPSNINDNIKKKKTKKTHVIILKCIVYAYHIILRSKHYVKRQE